MKTITNWLDEHGIQVRSLIIGFFLGVGAMALTWLAIAGRMSWFGSFVSGIIDGVSTIGGNIIDFLAGIIVILAVAYFIFKAVQWLARQTRGSGGSDDELADSGADSSAPSEGRKPSKRAEKHRIAS